MPQIDPLPEWSIRRAVAGDEAALSTIGSATFLETFAGVLDGSAIIAHCQLAHGTAAYATYLADGAALWLAELDPGQAPIGFALMDAPDLPEMQQGDLELKRIYVLSRMHGTGLGTVLMREIVDAARAKGAHRLLLGVYAHNHRAIGFYRKNGFEQIATRQFCVGGKHYDDCVLAKVLDG